MLSEKGKYAAATQNRRTVWEKVVWPLILEIDDLTFSVKQYQKKRDEVCHKNNFKILELSRGLASLLQKGVIIKEDNMDSNRGQRLQGPLCLPLHYRASNTSKKIRI